MSDKFSDVVQFKDTPESKELIGKLAVELDISVSELLRACVRLGMPIIKEHHATVQIIAIEKVESIRQR